MTISQITGGATELTRPSSYSTDKSGAKVSLTFSLREGATDEEAQAMLDKVAAMAVAKAREMAGDKLFHVAYPPAGHNDDAARQAVQDLRASLIAASDPTSPAETISPKTIPVGNATSPVEIGSPSPALEITDAQLVAAVERKVAKLGHDAGNDMVKRQAGAPLVGDLIATYVPRPQKMYAIPPVLRPKFLAELEALKLPAYGAPSAGVV